MHGATLANQFDIPHVLRFEDEPGGLVRAVISTPGVEAALYLQGAHITQWTPHGQRPVLFLSPKSLFTPGKAIRHPVDGINEGPPCMKRSIGLSRMWSSYCSIAARISMHERPMG